ncbi:MAG: VanZ family protein [Lachnospiraceae bacterium]|nr:VanZ family protein [Lachnospiraceae bacterium]
MKKEEIEEQEAAKQEEVKPEESKQEKIAARRKKMKIVFLRNLAGVLAIMWMCIIFAFSAQTKEESGAVSQSFTYQLVSNTRTFFNLDLSDARVKEIADAIEGFVRKAAHMTEFGILSVLIFIWIGQWEMSLLRHGLTASGAAAVYAASDEIHQLFVPGRAGRFSDVCIDSAGAVLGVVVFVVIVKLVTTIRSLKKKREERRLCEVKVQTESPQQIPQTEEAQED